MTTEERTTLHSPSPAGRRSTMRANRRARATRTPKKAPQPPQSPLVRLIGMSVFIVLAATTIAVLGNMLRAPEYGAVAEILYRLDDPSGDRAERELATQQVILQGREVLQPVADEAGLTVEDLQEQLTVEVVGNSDVLRLRVGDPDPARALELTERVAETYVRTWVNNAAASTSETAGAVQARIDELTESLTAAQEQLEAANQQAGEGGPTAGQRQLQSEIEGLQQRLAGYRDQLVRLELQSGEQAAEVRILTSAYLLEDPISPGPLQAGAAGMMVGLLAAGALIAVTLRRGPPVP